MESVERAEHPTAQSIREASRVEWTLDENLTRDDVGMAANRDSAIYDDIATDDPLQMRLTIPDGPVIEQQVNYVSAWSSPGDAQPCRVAFSHFFTDPADVGPKLAEYQQSLELGDDVVDRWHEGYERLMGPEGANLSSELMFPSRSFGDITTSVEASVGRPEGETLLVLTFNRCP